MMTLSLDNEESCGPLHVVRITGKGAAGNDRE